MSKFINTDNIDILVEFFNKLYQAGELPKDWLKPIFIPIPKKFTTNKYEQLNLKTISKNHTSYYIPEMRHRYMHRTIYF